MSNTRESVVRAPFYELVAPNLYLGRTIATIMIGVWDAVARYRQRAAERRRLAETIAALRGLDERGLRDIGVHRSEIVSVARGAVAGEAGGGRRVRR